MTSTYSTLSSPGICVCLALFKASSWTEQWWDERGDVGVLKTMLWRVLTTAGGPTEVHSPPYLSVTPPQAEQNASLTWRYMQSWLTHTHMQWLQRAQGDSGSPPPAYDAFMSYWSYCNSELLKVSCQYASHNYKWDSCDIWYIYIKFHTNVPQSFIVIKPKMKWIWGYEANC